MRPVVDAKLLAQNSFFAALLRLDNLSIKEESSVTIWYFGPKPSLAIVLSSTLLLPYKSMNAFIHGIVIFTIAS